jgi:hypothetical protein
MNELLQNTDDLLPIAVIFLGCCVAVVGIICGSIISIRKTRMREITKREIAAYVAEGAMTPEQGERLLRADHDDDD